MRPGAGPRGAPRTVVSRSAEETASLGEALGRRLGRGDVVGLIGELGTGKTCFVQGIVRGLGVPATATSPTFVLVNEYRGRLTVYHVDAYRTERLEELLDLGLPELMGGQGVTLIEWADRIGPLLPPDAIVVRLAGVGDEPRTVTLEGMGAAVSDEAH